VKLLVAGGAGFIGLGNAGKFTEDSPLEPNSPYAFAKIDMEPVLLSNMTESINENCNFPQLTIWWGQKGTI
jgi:GDP-D-mannose dehydratase